MEMKVHVQVGGDSEFISEGIPISMLNCFSQMNGKRKIEETTSRSDEKDANLKKVRLKNKNLKVRATVKNVVWFKKTFLPNFNLFVVNVSKSSSLIPYNYCERQDIKTFQKTSFIINKNLTPTSKKRILNGALCALSLDSGIKWLLTSTIFFHPKIALLCRCYYDDSDPAIYKLSDTDNLIEINPLATNVRMYYLNRLTLASVCPKDSCVQSSLDGPDKVVYQSFSNEQLESTKKKFQKNIYSISIDKIAELTKLLSIKLPKQFPMLPTVKKQKHIKMIPLSKGTTVLVVRGKSDQLIELHFKDMGIACPYIPQGGISSTGIVTFYFVLKAEIMSYMKQCPSPYREDYNSFIKANSRVSLTCHVKIIGEEGLIIAYFEEENRNDLVCEERNDVADLANTVFPFDGGLVLSQYIDSDIVESEDPSEIVHLLHQTYGSSFQHTRRCVKNMIGINLYEAINYSSRPREDFIKGKSHVHGSEMNRSTFDDMLLPLTKEMISRLVVASLHVNRWLDPIFDSIICSIYDGFEGLNTRRLYTNLDIVTLGCTYSLAYANSEHLDSRDVFDKYVFEKFQEKITDLNEYIEKKKVEQLKRRNENFSLDTSIKIRNHLQNQIFDGKSLDSSTTCGYKFLDTRKGSHKDFIDYAFFIHSTIKIAVRLRSGVFHRFRGARHSHLTALPVLFDQVNDIVYLNHEEFNILAWGACSADQTKYRKRRQFYKENNNGQLPIGGDVTRHIFRTFLEQNPALMQLAHQQNLLFADDYQYFSNVQWE